jgi:histidyl-tRNA synthetase
MDDVLFHGVLSEFVCKEDAEDERAEREAGKVTLKDLNLGAQLAQAIESNEAWRRERPAQVEVPRAQLVQAVQDMLQP